MSRKPKILVAAAFAGLLLFGKGLADEGPLQRALKERAAESARTLPADVREVMLKAVDQLEVTGIEDTSLQLGESLPGGTFLNPDSKWVELAQLTGGKPAVITFYRGGWCPYCNLQLSYYQEALPELKRLGAELVAISPETPDNSLSTAEKNNLEFSVLSDPDNRFARRLGLVYELPSDLVALYKKFGLDLPKTNGNDKWELPLSATFVVDRQGRVVYRFVEADYKKRASVSDILDALRRVR